MYAGQATRFLIRWFRSGARRRRCGTFFLLSSVAFVVVVYTATAISIETPASHSVPKIATSSPSATALGALSDLFLDDDDLEDDGGHASLALDGLCDLLDAAPRNGDLVAALTSRLLARDERDGADAPRAPPSSSHLV